MKLVSEKEFEQLTGAAMPLQRNMSTFRGDNFRCGCGKSHVFGVDNIEVIAEAIGGKFVIQCPNDKDMLSLIKTKMKFGLFYQGLEFIAGWKK